MRLTQTLQHGARLLHSVSRVLLSSLLPACCQGNQRENRLSQSPDNKIRDRNLPSSQVERFSARPECCQWYDRRYVTSSVSCARLHHCFSFRDAHQGLNFSFRFLDLTPSPSLLDRTRASRPTSPPQCLGGNAGTHSAKKAY